jgi:hypothetical protein
LKPTPPVSQVVQDPAEAGREAVRRHAWEEGYELLKQADGTTELSGDDLEIFANAALWTAGLDEFLPLMERAYAAHTRAGDGLRAAFVAIHLAHDYSLRLEKSVANGWLRRAQRLLEDEEEAPEHGYLKSASGHSANTTSTGRSRRRAGPSTSDAASETGLSRSGASSVRAARSSRRVISRRAGRSSTRRAWRL